MRKLSQDLQILSEMEIDQLDIAKIKEQRQVVARIQGTLRKKDEQVEKLKSLLQKYQQYQQKYTSLKVQLAERTHLMAKKDNQCKMLKRQLQDLLQQHHQIQQKMKQYDSQRQSLIRERHTIETANKQIENTFKQYQSQCRKRQNALNFDLERAYQRIKESNSRIDELELIAEQKKELDEKIKQNQKRINKSIIVASQQKLKTPQHNSNKTQNESQSLIEEITKLREELLAKQQELTANRVLNYELTLEYDNSITRITGLQTQVSKYRRQNNELKKIVSLLRQQEKCKQIQEKYTLRNNTNFGTPCSDEEGGSQCSEDALLHKHFIPKTTDAVAIHS